MSKISIDTSKQAEYYKNNFETIEMEGGKFELALEVEMKIKKYLIDNGVSQAHVSRETKINPVKLNLALNGNRRLTFDEYSVICGVLGVNTDYFIKPRLPDKQAQG